MTPGYWRIDGPPPSRPLYGLLQAALAPAAGVRVVPDTDAVGVERWGNGVIVWPYPSDTGVFEAVESSIMAREFLTGTQIGANPHLADGNGTFPNGDTVTSIKNGIATLEDAIAATGRQGLIHVPPSVIIGLAGNGFIIDNKTGVVRTINGTVVIPDMGYAVAGSKPPAHAAPGATQSWIYATGPVDIRQSEIFVMPSEPSQAVDRGSGGATNGRPNSVTYRVERYTVVDWDTVLQAAVLVDRCKDVC